MAIRLWPKEFERRTNLTREEKRLMRFASENFNNGHLVVGIDPLGLSTNEVHIGMMISPNEGLITFSIMNGEIDSKQIDLYITAVTMQESMIYKRLLDSKSLITRTGEYKVLRFPYRHIFMFANQNDSICKLSESDRARLSPYATFRSFMPIDYKGKIKRVSELGIFSNIRQQYDPDFKQITDIQSRAIFERLAPEYTVVMNELEPVTVKENTRIVSDNELKITGHELEFRTFTLDDYQVNIVNEMGRDHRVILANPGAGKSVLLLSKAFKYASMYKDEKILLTCFNANLSDLYSFKRACADFGDNNNLYIMTFHKLAKKIYDEILHISYEGDFPNDDEVKKLLDYIKSGRVQIRFLAIFIDEVQIYNPLYLEVCYNLLADHPDRVFLLAGDLNQTVRTASRRGEAPWKRMENVSLDFTGRVRYIEKNYRNSYEIAEYLQKMLVHMNSRFEMLGVIDKKEFDYNQFVFGQRHSMALEVWSGINRMNIKQQTLKALDEIVTKYKIAYSDVAIMFPYKKHDAFRYYIMDWIMAGLHEKDIPFSVITQAGGYIDERKRYSETRGVVLSTIDSSLGLDFKAIILTGLHPYNYAFTEKDKPVLIDSWKKINSVDETVKHNVKLQMRKLYTACSRARDILYIVSDLKPNTPMEDLIMSRGEQ